MGCFYGGRIDQELLIEQILFFAFVVTAGAAIVKGPYGIEAGTFLSDR